MAAPVSFIPELEEVLQHGSPERRAETLRRITALFLDGASRFNEDHVRLFDDVFSRLLAEIEAKARAELSHRLAPLGNAPLEVVRRLAHDDDIAVAGPVLEESPRLSDADLADNRGARLSDGGFCALVGRAEKDGALAEKVGSRPDLPPRLFRDLLLKATEVVQQRLFAGARPEVRSEIRRVLAKISDEVGATAPPRDYSVARRAVEALQREGGLTEAALVDYAKKSRYEETIAALACLCAVPIEVVDRLMGGERPDPILILCKSAGWGWPTAKAIIMARAGGKGTSSQGLDTAFANFERLSPTTAQRVMRFWQARTTEGGRSTTHDGRRNG